MSNEWDKINERLKEHHILIPTGTLIPDAIHSLIDKLDEQGATIVEMQWALEKMAGDVPETDCGDMLEQLIKCRELAAKGSKFAGELTRDVIEEGLVEVDAIIKKAQGEGNERQKNTSKKV